MFKDLRDFGCSKLLFSKYLSLLFVPFPRITQPIISSNKIIQNSGLPSRTLVKIHLILLGNLVLFFTLKSLLARLKDLALILEGGELETFPGHRGGEEESGMNSSPILTWLCLIWECTTWGCASLLFPQLGECSADRRNFGLKIINASQNQNLYIHKETLACLFFFFFKLFLFMVLITPDKGELPSQPCSDSSLGVPQFIYHLARVILISEWL